MNKYDSLKVLNKIKARTNHICSNCNAVINKNEFYFAEQLENKFLHTLSRKKFCSDCHEKFGDALLHKKLFQKVSRTLSDFK